MSLLLCASCSRHVRASELVCPFCGAAALAPSGPPQVMPSGATRAHIFLGVLGLAAATSAAACNKTEPPTNEPSQGVVQPYGAPMPVDAGVVPGAPSARVAPDGGALKPPSPSGAYGAPPKPG